MTISAAGAVQPAPENILRGQLSSDVVSEGGGRASRPRSGSAYAGGGAASVGLLLAQARSRLASRGVPEASASAEFLMAAALGIRRGELRARFDEPVAARPARKFGEMISERARRAPIAYILGAQEFMGMDFEVAPGVLIPRPETELLVEAALAALAQASRNPASRPREHLSGTLGDYNRPVPRERAESVSEGGERFRGRVLDIGTGSGCIALAVARRLPLARVTATDSSPAALRAARRNARRHGLGGRVTFVLADLYDDAPVPGSPADLVVSNPPYIPSRRLGKLEPEVLAEPRRALDGGEDGLECIRAIVRAAPKLLRPGGILALEIDHGQGSRVRGLLRRGGFHDAAIRSDLGGLERVALGRLLQ